MAARDRWAALEEELNLLEDNFQQNTEDAIGRAAERLINLADRTETFLDRHALGSLTLFSPAEHAMTVAPVTCSRSDSLNAAAKIMWEEDCGIVPVIDSTGLLVGVITDRDICMACYTQGRSPAETTVGSAMSRKPYGIRLEASLSEVLEIMSTRQVRRVPVISADGHLLGIVSLADLFRHLPEERAQSDLEAALTATLVAVSAKRARGMGALAAE